MKSCWMVTGTSTRVKIFSLYLNKMGMDNAECNRKVLSGRKVADEIKSFENAIGLSLV